MQNALLTKVVNKNKREVPTFRPGDTIRVHVKGEVIGMARIAHVSAGTALLTHCEKRGLCLCAIVSQSVKSRRADTISARKCAQ